jgi:hypothetical protein
MPNMAKEMPQKPAGFNEGKRSGMACVVEERENA